MASDYLIVHKKILPDYLEKVIEAREMLNSHEVETITEAVKKAGISRNTYYKYKDVVFLPEETHAERKAVFSLIVKHEAGALSNVLTTLSSLNASVITISQSIPVAGKAGVLIAVDVTQLNSTVDDMMSCLKKIPQVTSVHLDSME